MSRGINIRTMLNGGPEIQAHSLFCSVRPTVVSRPFSPHLSISAAVAIHCVLCCIYGSAGSAFISNIRVCHYQFVYASTLSRYLSPITLVVISRSTRPVLSTLKVRQSSMFGTGLQVCAVSVSKRGCADTSLR